MVKSAAMTATTTSSNPDRFAPDSLHVVFGCNGPVGVALLAQLAERGVRVRGVCRSGVAEAPAGVEIVAGDAADRRETPRLAAGAAVIYSTIGVEYQYQRWIELWPPIIDGLLDAATTAKARLVFADNLYCYGPQMIPLREDLPMTVYGKKPALRARLAKRLFEAHRAGRVQVAVVRASDFYGPRVRLSGLGERVFPKLLAGKPAQVLGDPDVPHSYTYVPDFARAMVSVADSDDAWGEAWHVPSAPARSHRELVEVIARLAGGEGKLQTLSPKMLRFVSLFSPKMRELKEMLFVWDRPYQIDHAKFAARFWSDFTPLEEGLAATVDWYRGRG